MNRVSPIVFAIIAATLNVWGCAGLPTGFERPVSHALTHTQDSALGKFVAAKQKDFTGKSGFHLLPDGLDAFVARAVLARMAERSIDAQYYLYHHDLVGRLFSYVLIQAADRGVRVRLLVDDMDLAGRDLAATVMDAHPNIEVRIFNPFSRKSSRTLQFVTRMGSVTRRMHNKSFTVDNQMTILGGRNIGDEYFAADPALTFADLDVIAIGPVAREVSASFDQYWNSELAYPATVLRGEPPTDEEIRQKRKQLDAFVAAQADSDYMRALRHSSLYDLILQDQVTFRWGEANVVYDRPEKLQNDFEATRLHLSPQLAPYWEAVEEELIIFSPYFVPGKSGTAFLAGLARRGVRVRILTNSLASNDVGIVHAGYAKYRKDLLRAGVELYEMNRQLSSQQRRERKGPGGSSKASLHAKSFVFDRRLVFVGSLNLDPRALKHNTEIGVVISQEDIAAGMADWFDRNIAEIAFRLELVRQENGSDTILWHGIVDGEQKTFDADPYAGFWRRLGIGFLSLLPIESQL